MITESLDDLADVLGLDGQPALPRRGRPQTPAAKRQIDALFMPAPEIDAPAESYWVGASREELRARAAARLPLMQRSKFGRIPTSYLAERV